METTFEKLRKLQEVLSKRIEVEKDIDDIPKALLIKEELLNRLQKSFIEKNDNKVSSEQELARLKRLMNDAERSREASEKRMDEISTQREYEALEREIKVSTEAEQEHRREIQKVEKTLEVLAEMLTSEEDLLNQQKQEIDEEKARIVAIINDKKESMGIIKNKSGLGIVPVLSGVCSGCHMTLPAQFANDVRRGDEILFCPYCSRILFHEDGNEDGYVTDDVSTSGSDGEASLSDLIDDDFLLD
ncbi:MAG: hypothetical protein B6229_08785 [Spirochaetaceae bacterium 4572_7]|nr:MAG: hypothetical protein B6229_08785 [Spirochaetaceae bacterium 4572_7]